jgi:hypothetical protein
MGALLYHSLDSVLHSSSFASKGQLQLYLPKIITIAFIASIAFTRSH